MANTVKKRTLGRRIGYAVYLVVAVFFLLEVSLRIYNPFHFRLKGDKILLPINQRATITNTINPKLDRVIVNTRNSLGFRGPEPPADWRDHLTIITVGGSTTECHFLNDNRTWPFLLGAKLTDSFPDCWLNNAGLDGHSTFGHTIFLNDYIKHLRPRVVIFLVGVNDVETDGPSFHDRLNTRGGYADLKHFIFQNSDVLNLVLNLVRGWRAQRFNNTTNTMLVMDSSRKRELSDSVIKDRLERQAPFLAGYRRRLEGLADTCVAWGILPVFVTQPNLFGVGRDPETGVDLSLFPCDPNDAELNGKLMWQMLERYNDVVRSVGAVRHVPVIDLARKLPKNSLYYYDMSHFTNAGAQEVADLLAGGLMPVLDADFPAFRK